MVVIHIRRFQGRLQGWLAGVLAAAAERTPSFGRSWPIEVYVYKVEGETLSPFRNAPSRWRQWVLNTLPPAPSDHHLIEVENLHKAYGRRHWIRAAALLSVVAVLALIVRYVSPSWARVSLLELSLKGLTSLEPPYGDLLLGLGVGLVLARLILRRRSQPGDPTQTAEGENRQKRGLRQKAQEFFNRAALREEQTYREGAEHWSKCERIWSCVVFGMAHFTNWVIPLTVLPALAVGGGFFMAIYLRSIRRTNNRQVAVVEAAITHRAYNTLAIALIAGTLVWFLGASAYEAIVGGS